VYSVNGIPIRPCFPKPSGYISLVQADKVCNSAAPTPGTSALTGKVQSMRDAKPLQIFLSDAVFEIQWDEDRQLVVFRDMNNWDTAVVMTPENFKVLAKGMSLFAGRIPK
jgi:hypothetical protein